MVLGVVNSLPFQMRRRLSHDDHYKMALPRRTFLRGLGATLALPLLDAMVPAFTADRENGRQRRNAVWGLSTSPTASR